MRTFTDRIDVIGTAKARRSVTLTSDSTELITSINFTSGQYVRQGSVLAVLKSDEQRAEVVNAQAALNKAKSDYDRFAELGRRGFAPRASIDQYRAAFEQARANLQAAQARLRDRVIRAPFSGTVGLSDAAPGMLITPGTPIATLDDLSVVNVDFDVPERFLGNVRPGTGIESTAEAYPNEIFRGSISRIDTRVKPETRAVTARAEFVNPGGRLKPGMLMKVGIAQGLMASVAVPESAVQYEGDQAYVFGIARQGERTVAVRKTVIAGAREAGFIQILEGLKPGDRIVADGLNRVQPNQPIRIAGQGGGRGRGGGAPGAPQKSR
jgi:membrane fusion protein (multidrug efflux system)